MTARRVSQSELKSFRRCRRKWWLENVRSLEFARPQGAGALWLGTKVHLGLEAYYTAGALEPQTAYDAVVAAHNENVHKVNLYYLEKELDGTEALAALDKETDLAIIMLEGYFEWVEETSADAELEVVAAEQQLEVPFIEELNGEPWSLVGKIDLRIRRADSGLTAFLDHKSVANFTDLPKTAQLNEQGLMYNVLLRLSSGEHVDGMTFNMLRKVKRTARANPPFYARHEVRWNATQLNEYVGHVWAIVHDIAEVEARIAAGWSHQAAAYPNPTGDCAWDCDFFLVCPLFDDGSRAEDMLAAHYRAHNPLERYDNKKEGTE